MARLPNPGGDDNQWGDILNDFLKTEHNADGSQKPLPQSKITNLTNDLVDKEDKSAKGSANGYAPLDSSSKVPAANLPTSTAPADASTTTKGLTKLSTAPTSATDPIAIAQTDPKVIADQVAGVASIRTLGYGPNQAAQGSAVNTRLQAVEGSGPLSELWADAPTGVAATDHPMLTQLISNCPTGGIVHLRSGGDTPYALNGPLVISKSMALEGATLTEVQFALGEPANAGTGEWPSKTPFLRGSVLLQTQAGADGLRIEADAVNVNLRNIGIKFDTAIRFQNTGYGVHALPATNFSGKPDHGLLNSIWENVRVWGHDGNHYGFRLLNPLLCTLRHLRAYGGGMMELIGDSSAYNYGNLVIENPYGRMFVGGSAHGYSLQAVAGHLNIITFIRPQCNIGGAPSTFPEIAASPALGQDYFRADTPTQFGILNIIQPDFEGAGYAALVRFGTGRHFITPEGYFGTDPSNKEFIIMSNPKGGSALASDLEQSGAATIITESGGSPTVVVGSGSGVGATASLTGSDFRGTLLITTGASGISGASGAVAATMTFALASRVKNMTLAPANLAAGSVGALVNVSGVGATASIRYTGVAPAASTTHSWVYRCDPI